MHGLRFPGSHYTDSDVTLAATRRLTQQLNLKDVTLVKLYDVKVLLLNYLLTSCAPPCIALLWRPTDHVSEVGSERGAERVYEGGEKERTGAKEG